MAFYMLLYKKTKLMTLLIGAVAISATLFAPFFSIRFTQQALAQNMTASETKQFVITLYNQGTESSQ